MRSGAVGQLKRHRIARLCTSHGCVDVTEGVGGGSQVIAGHQISERGMKKKTFISGGMRSESYHPTLPPEIATDAAVYVAVIVVFYAAIILLLVGTNLHRLRGRRRNRPQHHQHRQQQQQQQARPVETAASAEVSKSLFFSAASASSSGIPGSVSTTVVTEKNRWSTSGNQDAVVV